MEQMKLSLGVMLEFLYQAIAEINKVGKHSNVGNHSIKDTILGLTQK